MEIDWHYPWMWGIDTTSHFKSLWLGWWLIVWWVDIDDDRINVNIRFQPGT